MAHLARQSVRHEIQAAHSARFGRLGDEDYHALVRDLTRLTEVPYDGE